MTITDLFQSEYFSFASDFIIELAVIFIQTASYISRLISQFIPSTLAPYVAYVFFVIPYVFTFYWILSKHNHRFIRLYSSATSRFAAAFTEFIIVSLLLIPFHLGFLRVLSGEMTLGRMATVTIILVLFVIIIESNLFPRRLFPALRHRLSSWTTLFFLRSAGKAREPFVLPRTPEEIIAQQSETRERKKLELDLEISKQEAPEERARQA